MGRGVVAAIATNTRFNESEFDAFAAQLLGDGSNLRSIAIAPNMVVRMVYPDAGNEAVNGLDYATTPSQRDAPSASRKSGSW